MIWAEDVRPTEGKQLSEGPHCSIRYQTKKYLSASPVKDARVSEREILLYKPDVTQLE